MKETEIVKSEEELDRLQLKATSKCRVCYVGRPFCNTGPSCSKGG